MEVSDDEDKEGDDEEGEEEGEDHGPSPVFTLDPVAPSYGHGLDLLWFDTASSHEHHEQQYPYHAEPPFVPGYPHPSTLYEQPASAPYNPSARSTVAETE